MSVRPFVDEYQLTVRPYILIGLIAAAMLVCGSVFAVVLQEKERLPRKVKRVKRPVFTEKDWDGIYFNNLFSDGLVGQRPKPEDLKKTVPQVAESDVAVTATSGSGWSSVIESSVVEDEVKQLQQALIKDITTPVRFKSEYLKSHQSFSLLSMLFAIVREYEGDIRWKKDATDAQAAFARSAAASRVGTAQAYQNCRLRRDDLVELVRGGALNADEKGPEQLDWSQVVDRNPLMVRLGQSVELLKPAVSSKSEFVKNMEVVFHESNMIAAIGQVLIQDGMDEWEEESYVEFAKSMSAAAAQAIKACKSQDFDTASQSVNLITQCCSNCHEEWN